MGKPGRICAGKPSDPAGDEQHAALEQPRRGARGGCRGGKEEGEENGNRHKQGAGG